MVDQSGDIDGYSKQSRYPFIHFRGNLAAPVTPFAAGTRGVCTLVIYTNATAITVTVTNASGATTLFVVRCAIAVGSLNPVVIPGFEFTDGLRVAVTAGTASSGEVTVLVPLQ